MRCFIGRAQVQQRVVRAVAAYQLHADGQALARRLARQGQPRQSRRVHPAGVHGMAARSDFLAIDVRRDRPLRAGQGSAATDGITITSTSSNSVDGVAPQLPHLFQDLPQAGCRNAAARLSAMSRYFGDACASHCGCCSNRRASPIWPICGQASRIKIQVERQRRPTRLGGPAPRAVARPAPRWPRPGDPAARRRSVRRRGYAASVIPGLTGIHLARHHGCRIESGMTAVA